MVSRSLEKMMLIAIGLSTAVIVGVPVLMYAMDTINTTSQLQQVQYEAEHIHNSTGLVDTGMINSTIINIWVNPGVTVTATGNTLTVLYNPDGGSPRTWSQSYVHEISIDSSISTLHDVTPYTMDIILIGNVIHIWFYPVPI